MFEKPKKEKVFFDLVNVEGPSKLARMEISFSIGQGRAIDIARKCFVAVVSR